MVKGVTLRPEDAREIAHQVRRMQSVPDKDVGGAGVPGRFLRDSNNLITIQNETSEDLDVFSIVRVSRDTGSSSMFTVADTDPNLINKQQAVWDAEAADEGLTGQYAVLQTNALIGQRGQALLVGVTKVKLDDTNEGDFADPQKDNLTHMKTKDAGKFPVLVVYDDGEADTWGYVLMGGGSAAASFFGIVQTCNYSAGTVTVKRAEGELGALTLVSGTVAVIAYQGVGGWFVVGDEVYVKSVPDEITTIEWFIEQPPLYARHWTPPTEGELADDQDDPAAVTSCS